MIHPVWQDRYELIEVLDDGPVFTLSIVLDKESSRRYFLRELKQEYLNDAEFIDRLRETVRTTALVDSPNIEKWVGMPTKETGEIALLSNGVTGQLLSEKIARLAPYSVPVLYALGTQVLQSLQRLHAEGLAHGELNPHTLLMTAEGKVVLMQPAFWMAYGGSARAAMAVLPRLAPYLAPELSEGKMPSPSGDVYAFSAIMFELATGRPPFGVDGISAMARKHSLSAIPSARSLNPNIPIGLDDLIQAGLTKSSQDRIPNAKMMLEELRMLQGSGKPTTTPRKQQTPAAVQTESASKPSSTPAKEPKTQPNSAALEAKSTTKIVRNKAPKSPGKMPVFFSFLAYASILVLIVLAAGWVSWNLGTPKPQAVPKIVGKPFAQAEKEIKELGLQLRLSASRYDDKVKEGVIISTSPRPGESVRKGAFVSAIVSGGPQFIKVPDLRGASVEEAKSKLNNKGLSMFDSIEEVYRPRQREGIVIGQIPEPGSQVERATRVRVAIASKRDRSSRAERTRGEYELIFQMPADNDPVYVRVEIVDADGTRTVFPDTLLQPAEKRQIISEGRGSSVDFKIYFNGQLVRHVSKKAREEV